MKDMEFEGKTEREALAKAAAELGSESFDVEILEKSNGLFGRGKFRIRVRALSDIPDPLNAHGTSSGKDGSRSDKKKFKPKKELKPKERERTSTYQKIRPEEMKDLGDPPDEMLTRVSSFIGSLVEHMGYTGTVNFNRNEREKIYLELQSQDAQNVIGRKGKTLDALQLLANVYWKTNDTGTDPWRIILDCEDHRLKHEKYLLTLAQSTAEEVFQTKSSQLLPSMNPYERRLVHAAISERGGVDTKSEGAGPMKKIRVLLKEENSKN